MPITTMLRRFERVDVDAAAEGLTQAQQEEIAAMTTDLESRLSGLASAGNREARAQCILYDIAFEESPA